ncbi:hypothetical protein BgiMline_012375 [Biomphalaria glabrata]|nr:hypothetical protein BgiMline_032429 [Biomphalaria glabrata]
MTLRSESEKTSHDFLLTLQNITDGSEDISQLFQQVPVTDLDSGLTFKNISIYLCNKRSVRSLLFWNVHMNLFDLKDRKALPPNLLSQVRYKFFPPRVKQADKILKCSQDMRLHYKKAPSKNYDKLLQLKYLGKKGIHIYCSLCQNSDDALTEKDEIETYERIEALFPVMASFTFEHNTFYLQIQIIPELYNGIGWKSILCSNTNKELKLSSQCEINACDVHFGKSKEGECKYLFDFKLAVLEEEKQISRTFLNKLSYYVQCYLSTYAGYEIINKGNASKIYYNLQFERLFYVTEFIVLTNRIILIETNEEDELFHFRHFAKLTRSLVSVRAKMTTKDLQPPPDWDKLEFFEIIGTQYKYLLSNDKIMTSINTLNRTQKLIPVCAQFFPTFAFVSGFLQVEPVCIYVSKTVNDADGNRADDNGCLNIFTLSGFRHIELSQTLTTLICLSSLMSVL